MSVAWFMFVVLAVLLSACLITLVVIAISVGDISDAMAEMMEDPTAEPGEYEFDTQELEAEDDESNRA